MELFVNIFKKCCAIFHPFYLEEYGKEQTIIHCDLNAIILLYF